MLKKLPKSNSRGTVGSAVKLIILAEIAAVGVSYYVWRKMCRQQGLLNYYRTSAEPCISYSGVVCPSV